MALPNKKLIPTENLIGKTSNGFIEKRAVTSIWVDAKTHKNFIDACAIAGRKTCSVIESFEKGFVKCVKNSIENIDACSVKPIVFNNMVLNISEKYAKRGRKEMAEDKSGDPYVSCPEANGKKTFLWGPHVFTCKFECKFGEKHYEQMKHAGRKLCPVYERARFQ